MVNVRFGNYEQFKRFIQTAPQNIQRILLKAYPDFAQRLYNDYKTATTKVVSGSTPKQIGMIKDTAKAASTATKVTSVGGKLAKGAGSLATKIAPIQGAVNLFSRDSDVMDRLAGAGMIGTGIGAMAGSTVAAPFAAALVGGDLLKKNVARPVGEKIGELIYGKEPNQDIYSGLVDVDIPDPMMKQFTPEEEAKLRAYNKGIIDKTLAQADVSLARGNEEIKAWDNMINGNQDTVNQIENDVRGGSYPVSQSGYGFYPQNSQNAQEGGLNNFQDNLYLEQYKPSLKPIVEPLNYSNEYLASQNNLINQLQQNANQGVQNNMEQFNPYDLGGLRPYTQITPEAQQGIDYQKMLDQFNAAVEADRKQNNINQIVNAFGALGTPSERAPIYYVGAQGDLRAIQLDQPGSMAPLPTNTSSNVDKLAGQLKIQQAQYEDMLARQKQAAADLKAEREYIANQNMMNALGRQFGVDPSMFANPDIAKAALQYVFNPNIQANANIQETIGKAPTQAMLKAAEQRGQGAIDLDKIQLGKQYDAMIANINNNAKMEEQAMIEAGLDRRTAASLATQRALAATNQAEQNYRAILEDQRARDLAEYGRGTQMGVAQIYANRSQGSQQLPIGQQVYMEAVKSGTPIPQALKYAQVVDPTFGLSEAEIRELGR